MMSGTDKECHSFELIDSDGEFNVTGFEKFQKKVEMDNWGVSYNVVSIIGPQSGGKSTLLNHLFGTRFRVMNAAKARSRTTTGIWMAKCADSKPCTLVMDVEGTDGGERGEDDTVFEKWSALFAIAVSDILLINIWCHDIGREQAACKPLLRTVFQVMMRLLRPRKITLMFVIRDKTKTPLDMLKIDLTKSIDKIWDSIQNRAPVHKRTPRSEFFKVEVVALSNYEEKPEEFKEQVTGLRTQIFHSVKSDKPAGGQMNVVPASSFSLKAEKIWKEIKDNKDLNLPSVKVMVARVRCDEIAEEVFQRFIGDYCHMQDEKGSQKELDSLCETCLSKYDEDTQFYDEDVRSEKREDLKAKLLQFIFLQETDRKSNSKRKLKKVVDSVVVTTAAAVITAGVAVSATPLVIVGAVIPIIGGILRISVPSICRRISGMTRKRMLVQPADQSKLEHIGSSVLNEFKVAFEKTLDGGDGILAAARACAQSSVNLFIKECEDAGIELAHRDTIEARKKLNSEVTSYIENRAKYGTANSARNGRLAADGLSIISSISSIVASVFQISGGD